MVRKSGMVHEPGSRHKVTRVLSEAEIVRLVHAYVAEQTCVPEDDIMVLIQWAEAQRLGAVILDMVLAGTLCALVEEGDVKVRLPGPQAA